MVTLLLVDTHCAPPQRTTAITTTASTTTTTTARPNSWTVSPSRLEPVVTPGGFSDDPRRPTTAIELGVPMTCTDNRGQVWTFKIF